MIVISVPEDVRQSKWQSATIGVCDIACQSPRHYKAGLALCPPLMPRSIDSVPLQGTFVREGNGTDSVENTARHRTPLSRTPRLSGIFVSVTQLECVPVSNVLNVSSSIQRHFLP